MPELPTTPPTNPTAKNDAGCADTIAAAATPPGPGGIGIIRISGPGSLDAALRVFRPASGGTQSPDRTRIRTRYLHHGLITAPDGDPPPTIDEGFMVFMKGPASYTGEDTVELHCHGGPLVMQKVLGAVLGAGARQAGPGEFTKRAFLNGKLDLARAEAVGDLIMASTEASLEAARGRLDGRLSERISGVKEALVTLLVRLEAELDFPEDEPADEVGALTDEDILDHLGRASKKLRRLLRTYEEGRVLKEGVKALILGRPNVGKSTLLNVLLKEDRAIVTDTPGTTRDVLEEVVVMKGIAVRLMDTAGLAETTDPVEAKGVSLAKGKVAGAGVLLFVIDSSAPDHTEDLSLLEEAAGKKLIIVANKTDLVDDKARGAVKKAFKGKRVVFISALKERGIADLEDALFEEAVGEEAVGHHWHEGHEGAEVHPGEFIASAWQKEALEKALEGAGRVEKAVRGGLTRDLVGADLRWTVDRLGELTGETTTEDILDRIFSEFCIGK
jgi:tRNA modification GTPase